jgi:hypothetical protein
MRTVVEGSVDLSVVVAILLEDVPQEHQFGLQAVFITESSGPMHQCRQYRLFIGWVMIGLGVEVETGVCGLAVLCVPESHQVSCKYQCPGRGGGLHFLFHGELNGLMDVVGMV